MEIKKFKIDPDDVKHGIVTKEPLLRTQLDGNGCDCGTCRDYKYWITISDGSIGLSVKLTKEEAEKIIAGVGMVEFSDD